MLNFARRSFAALVAALLAGVALGATPPTVSLSATPASGGSPLSVTLTWSTTNAQSCTAAATPAATGWSGTEALSGTAKVSVSASTAFSLTCVTSGTATLTWVAPITNVDGSAISTVSTDPTAINHYNVYQTSGTAIGFTSPPTNVGNVLTYIVTSLTVGLQYTWAVSAVNNAGLESALSTSVSLTPTGTPATATANVTVTPFPSQPTGFSVTETQ
jgi:hypothetical protein